MFSRKSRLALAELYANTFGLTGSTVPRLVWDRMDNEYLYNFLYANNYSEHFCDAARKLKAPNEIKEFILRFDDNTILEEGVTIQGYLRKLTEDVIVFLESSEASEYLVQNTTENLASLIHALNADGFTYRNHKLLEEKDATVKTTEPTQDVSELTDTIPLADSLIGRALESKYQIIELLGEGGMGAVYRARRLRLGDEVAVKVLQKKYVADEVAVRRFEREAQAAAQLKHPNIVTIYDFGEAMNAGAPAFIVMELVSGESLRQLLKRTGKLAPQRAISLMRSICTGVSAAHRNNVIHRDIKPDNIMVVPPHSEHESETIKVLDFGLAKLRVQDSAIGQTLTQPGVVLGTPYYMSPEQYRGEPSDARSDVYSLGITLYEMLSGMPPFTASNYAELAAKHLNETPPSLPAGLSIPSTIEAVIMRALAKDKNERQENASELARELIKVEERAVELKSVRQQGTDVHIETAETESTQPDIAVISGLTAIDTLLLKLSCEEAIAANNVYVIESQAILDKAKVFDIPEEELVESFQILSERGYISPHEAFGSDALFYDFAITAYGFNEYAKVFIEDYASVFNSVILQIVELGKEDNRAIIQELNQPELIVDQTILFLAHIRLIKVSEMSGGYITIDEVSAELRRQVRKYKEKSDTP